MGEEGEQWTGVCGWPGKGVLAVGFFDLTSRLSDLQLELLYLLL